MPTGTPKNGINKSWYKKGHEKTVGAFKKGHTIRNTGRTRLKKGNTLWLGRKHSEESKKKMTESLIGRKPPKTAFKKGQNVGNLNFKWKGGKPKCLECNKQLSTYKSRYCRKHFGQYQSKENHPSWVNGNYKKSDRPYGDSASYYFRTKIYKRDKYKCKINNQDCKGRLEAHHILSWREYPELRYDINNGITLCHFHHPRRWEEEKRLIPTFQELVSVSKVQN